ncbi:MAG: Transcription termination factor Rho, partial [uncultured Actinomycetospora sp.]
AHPGRRHPRRARQLRVRPHLGLRVRAERRLRVDVAGAQARAASRRRRHRPGAPAARGRAEPPEVQPAGAHRLDQRAGPRAGAQPPGVHQAHAALPERAPAPRDRVAPAHHARHRPGHARGQGPARADRLAAEGRQDDGAAGDRQRDHHEQPRGPPHGRARRRAAGGGHRHAALGEGRGHRLDLRPAAVGPHLALGAGHRAGQAPGRDGPGRGGPARLDHPPGPRLQPRGPRVRAHPVRRCRLDGALPAEALPRRRPQHRGRRLAHHLRDGPGRDRVDDGHGDLRGVQGHGQRRAQARPQARRQAHLPRDRPRPVGHAQGGAAALAGRDGRDPPPAPCAGRAGLPAGHRAGPRPPAQVADEHRVPHAGGQDDPRQGRRL